MSYMALYRTYRPKTFQDVVGQEAVIQTLLNALEFNKTAHAYLFSGPRGTGKTSVAKLFGKAINCFRETDETYPGCDVYHTLSGNDMTDIIELDAASNNGVDEIRDIRDKVKYMPSIGRYKIYIIDEVHMLTTGAFNALLKTLEEPPKHVIFILATTEIHKIPATILSRCQRFDFSLVEKTKIVDRLDYICKQENIEITKEAVEAIAKHGQGSVRDAISLLDQASAYAQDKIDEHVIYEVAGTVSKDEIVNLLTSIVNKNHVMALQTIENLLNQGKEVSRILVDFLDVLRDLLTAKAIKTEHHNQQQLLDQLSFTKLYHYLDVLNQLQYDIKFTSQKEAYLELAIIKMIEHQTIIQADIMTEIQTLRTEIETLKKQKIVIEQPQQALPKDDEQKKQVEETREPLVTIKDVTNILNHSDKDKKELLLKGWPSLEHYDEPGYELTANLLFKGSLEAVSKDDKMLLVYDDYVTCERMYDGEVKKQVLFILNQKRDLVKNYVAIHKKEWAVIKPQYIKLWKEGNKSPELEPIDLKLYKIRKHKDKVSEIVKIAKEYFGDDIEMKE